MRHGSCAAFLIVVLTGLGAVGAAAQEWTVDTEAPLAFNTNPPSSPVRLVFIHHSTGGNWLADPEGNGSGGDLGRALMNNNYYVSATNYGWGPDSIGEMTDIGHWWVWFRGEGSATDMAALYAESNKNIGDFGDWPRLGSAPAGENRIVMFKSCFPNSNLTGSPGDPATTGDNPMRGEWVGSDTYTVANAKGIYNDILEYFATRQDKLFVVVTAPPLNADETDATRAANARALNNWLVDDWLDGYPYHNVAVFDFYTVLTSNGGDAYTNDLGSTSGNHHRYRNGVIEHVTNQAGNSSRYGTSGDSHPTSAGGQKAAGEFLPLLNLFYHCWQGDGSCPGGGAPTCTLTCTATVPATAQAGVAVALSSTAVATSCSGSVTYDWNFGDGSAHATTPNPSHTWAAGTYTWTYTASVAGKTCTKSGQIVVSGQPPADAYAYVVPSVAHSSGSGGTSWRSDVAVVNSGGDGTATLHLTFYDYTTGAASAQTRTLALDATAGYVDILTSVFGFGASASVKGTLLVTANQPLAVSSRTYNQETATRTYGQYYPALIVAYPGGRAVDSIAAGDTGILSGLKKNAQTLDRTNVGIVNLSQASCTVSFQLVNTAGAAIGSARSVTADARRWKQEDDIFAKAGAGNQAVAYARVQVQTTGCSVWAYASVVDGQTGDPTTIPVVLP